MSGTGERFKQAGYTRPKPLIEVDGKPIIEHVVAMFPGEHRFIFICNEDHLAMTDMRSILERIAPEATILSIAPHKKGPVYAVAKAFDELDDDEETIVNYCDFAVFWDYEDFLQHTRQRQAQGCVPAYRGFHPHMLGTDNYAFIKDEQQWLQAIQEKQPFTENRMAEYASTGTYYFKSGALLKKYFSELLTAEGGALWNGEYYVSMIFNLLVRDQLPVSVYEVQHMLQWGTATDLQDYVRWSSYFRRCVDNRLPPVGAVDSICLFPMAGRGQRFKTENFAQPKPLIDVSGKPMFAQAVNALPPVSKQIFVCLAEHLANYPLAAVIQDTFSNSVIIKLEDVTEGQASTCQIGLHEADLSPAELSCPLIIGACDNGMLWDAQRYQQLVSDQNTDCLVFTFRGNTASRRNPTAYGWVDVETDGETIRSVSVKKPISDTPERDHAIVGSFYFREVRQFLEAFANLQSKNIRVNGEFYVDSLINEIVALGYKAKVFEVDDYVCWGTPDDLRTFQYWQSFFDKCNWHPYKLTKDPTVAANSVKSLEAEYRKFTQPCDVKVIVK